MSTTSRTPCTKAPVDAASGTSGLDGIPVEVERPEEPAAIRSEPC